MIRIVLATRNAHKVIEVQRIFEQVGTAVEILGTEIFSGLPDIKETGSTFAANALIKARAVCEHTGLPAMADDSGLCVDALNGMPGIFSARWAGRHGDDEANLTLLLHQLTDVADNRRSAAFHCAAALVTPEGDERICEGTLEGRLIREARGANGFGYDPIFLPTGYDITTAQMTPKEKDDISHRGQAFRALAKALPAN